MCRSGYWRRRLADELLPWVLKNLELGREVLEVGPGPGLTTDLLRSRTHQLTAIEIDAALASSLHTRLGGGNVRVIRGDATTMPFVDAGFSAALSFNMLHHVPSPALQDRLLREVCRVLKPGGVFAGVDSRQSLRMRLFHIHDTLIPVDPKSFGSRLETAGFSDVVIETNERAFRFDARRPM